MSHKAQKRGSKLKIDDNNEDVRRDKNNDTIDRARMSCILDLVLNQKSQQEIIKDIADGILNFNEIKEIFPQNFVQQLLQYTPLYTQNYVNRFKEMTDERIKGILNLMLSRKSRDEILKLITDYSLSLDTIQKSYLRRYVEEESSTNVSTTSSEKLSFKDVNDVVKNSKESKDVGTKKKRNVAKKGEKDVDTWEKENVEKVAKKVVKSKNEKRVSGIKNGNRVKEASKNLSLSEEDPLARGDDEKVQDQFGESLMQTHYEGFKESLLKSSEGDGASYKSLVQRDTKKKTTANSKSLANDDEKLAGAKKASKKVGKDVKSSVRNKGKTEVENFASLPRSDNYNEEQEKPKSDESDVENEDTSYVMQNDRLLETRCSKGRFDDFLQKSQTSLTSEERGIYGNEEKELNYVLENNYNIQFDTSEPKKLNCETKAIWVKEEPKSECSFNEFDYPTENCKEKVLNISKGAVKKTDSQKQLRTKRSNARTKVSNAGMKDERSKIQEVDRKDRRKEEKIWKNKKKMQKAMAQFSDQVVRLVKNMGYPEEDDESSFSSSSESSESCCYSSCSCCDYSSSDEYSEYTLCSCSNCTSSCSDTDYDNEE